MALSLVIESVMHHHVRRDGLVGSFTSSDKAMCECESMMRHHDLP